MSKWAKKKKHSTLDEGDIIKEIYNSLVTISID